MTYDSYVDLHRTKKKLEADLDNIKDEIAAAEQEILAKWSEEGATTVKMGGVTLWLDRKLWASTNGETDEAVMALESEGMQSLVKKTVNRNTLSALVRELADPLDSPEQVQSKLPGRLRQAIKVSETMNVRVRGL